MNLTSACASFFSLGGGGLCPPEPFLRGTRANQATGTRGKRVSPVKRTHRRRAGCPDPGLQVHLAGQRSRPVCRTAALVQGVGAVALTGEDRSPPPAATAAPVVRRRPRAAKARPDTSNCRGLPRRRCRRRR